MNIVGRRRHRGWAEIQGDPLTPFHFGRLLGANEMAITLLSQSDESENARHIAEVLQRMTEVFFVTSGEPEQSGAVTATMRTLGMEPKP